MISKESDWGKYYENNEIIPFGAHRLIYTAALDRLSLANPDLLAIKKPKNFLLGGFHPQNGSLKDFIDLCLELHSNPDDLYLAMDMNTEPLKQIAKNPGTLGIRARLESLPLASASVDVAFLDGTLDLINPKQAQLFFSRCQEILRPEGLVLATISDPLSPFLYNAYYTFETGARYQARSLKETLSLVSSSLKPVLVAEAESSVPSSASHTLIVFSKLGSLYPKDFNSYVLSQEVKRKKDL